MEEDLLEKESLLHWKCSISFSSTSSPSLRWAGLLFNSQPHSPVSMYSLLRWAAEQAVSTVEEAGVMIRNEKNTVAEHTDTLGERLKSPAAALLVALTLA